MTTQAYALVNPQGQVVNKIMVDPSTYKVALPPGWTIHLWDDATDGPAYAQYLAPNKKIEKPGRLARVVQWMKGHLRQLKTYVSTRAKLK